MRVFRLATTLMVTSLLAACGGVTTKPTQATGFLENYEQLSPVEVVSETQVWRWRSPEFRPANYHALKLMPVVFAPQPTPNDQVSLKVLNEIRHKINSTLSQQASASGIPISASSGAGVLTLRPAITSVNLSLQDMKITEAIPIRLVLSGAELALGLRDKDVTFLFEYELVDSTTGQIMMSGVRHANTQPLENDSEKLKQEHAKEMLENLSKDLNQNFSALEKAMSKKGI
ncbi:DUF3313 domain-containing protein [Pontibacterium sp. N1Y112]|uniref:DUF3313 domain-containing protein n=1 Tax=Pontibacterium sinense TaxID=2781979 RepID=A0A8J7FHC9_9GAMM|nr:DUF3313 domain-containing protein [Pontibacterium sinense]MBE9399381.1 DUF3313 domain-containing protein [Pontibacterium sinense]